MKHRIILFALLCAATAAWSAPQVPFHRGVNLSGWFQPEQVGRLPFSRYGEQDFANLKALGVDGVRLPINFAGLTGSAPGYPIDARVFPFLDQVVNWAEASGIALVLDNHSDPTDKRIRPDLGRFLEAVWTQMAQHYQSRSTRILFEIQNEPHDLGQSWAPLQQRAINAIRAIDQVHTIVVGGEDWNSIKGMLALPRYTDTNLVYTFHDYDPFVFTHQGASWTDLKDLSGVAFPPDGPQPQFNGTGKSGWVNSAVRDYYSRNPVTALASSLDSVAAFAGDRKVPVWCGEFGVYNLKSDPVQRVNWYRTMRSLLEKRSIPWTMWDYKDSFGIFQKDSAELFEQDLNLPLADALGFNTISQKTVARRHETEGFYLYRDSWEGGSHESGSNQKGVVDYSDASQPYQGNFSLKIADINRYGNVAWTFAPWKDLTALADKASVSMWVRSSSPQWSLEVRFVDGAISGGLPWRNASTIDSGLVAPDGEWHKVVIPLASMKVTGAWDGTWHEGLPGAFSWDRVDRLEIVAEHGDLAGTVNFDNVAVGIQ